MKSNKVNASSIMSSIVKYGAHILFVLGLGVMSYLSFVDNLGLDPSVRNLTTIALIAMVLNYMIWDSYYTTEYNNVMIKDIKNVEIEGGYCIHRRYYNARKGWQYQPLQKRIREFNQDFMQAYIEDVEDITGRKEADIIEQPYRYKYEVHKRNKIKVKKKFYPHMSLIWKLKHKKYPKSGIKNSRQMLNVLRVGKSSSMVIKVNAAEVYHSVGRVKKIIMSAFTTLLAAALIYDFIQGDRKSALLKMLLNIVILFTSFFFGSVSGNRGGQIKLAVAEEISERLEDWRNDLPSEEPYQKTPDEVSINEVKEDKRPVIEFT